MNVRGRHLAWEKGPGRTGKETGQFESLRLYNQNFTKASLGNTRSFARAFTGSQAQAQGQLQAQAWVWQCSPSPSTAGNKEKTSWMGTAAELDQALAWAELMTRDFWTPALLLGLVQTMLDFFHSGTELNHPALGETPGTWGQSLCLLQLQ